MVASPLLCEEEEETDASFFFFSPFFFLFSQVSNWQETCGTFQILLSLSPD